MKKLRETELTEAEVQLRFEGALKAALNTPPTPLKNMPPKDTAAQREAGKTKTKKA